MVRLIEESDVFGRGEIGRWTLLVLVVAMYQPVVLEPIPVTWYLLGDPTEWVPVSGHVMFVFWDWERERWKIPFRKGSGEGDDGCLASWNRTFDGLFVNEWGVDRF